MPRRARLIDFRTSSGPQKLGLCQSDLPGIATYVNEAQARLVLSREAGDTGWWGSWARMVFNVSQTAPSITTPREVARLERMTVCNRPVNIQNEFYEFLDFGIGIQPRPFCNYLETYERGVFPTFTDLIPGNKIIRVFLTSVDDVSRRVMVQGTDQNDNTIYTQDGLTNVQGVFVSLASPFADTPMIINSISGIQKDVTVGPVKFFEVDSAGNQRLLLTMEPSETVAAYRRYFVNGVPATCCNTGAPPQVIAMAKLELMPVTVDTDYLLIQNIQALIHETQSMRFDEMDSDGASKKSAEHHRAAIRMLQGELVHYEGKDRPAIEFKPFGSAFLERQRIGTLT